MTKRTISQIVLHFPITKIIIGIFFVLAIYVGSQYLLIELLNMTSISVMEKNLCVGVLSAICALITYYYLYKFYEKRTIHELSTKHIAKYLALGVLLGGTLQTLTVLVIYLKGGYAVIAINNLIYILPGLTMAFSSAIFEEILMRGIIFRIIEEKLGSYIALIISALLFGALHLGNPNSSPAIAIGLAIQAGLLLAAAYIYTRNLWFPIAIHFGWNFLQSSIFGAAVSGNNMGKSLITSEITGENWFTGGTFGPEGSIQATVFCLIATIFLLIFSFRQKKMIKPYWQ